MKRGFFVLVVTAQLAGCYASNEITRAGAGDASRSDARTLDAPVVLDTARPDAGRDAARNVDASCIENAEDRVLLACILSPDGVLPAMRESILDLERSSCRCPGERTCSVRAEGDILRIETRSCMRDIECDSCDFDQPCTIPPLEPGTYRLVVDGLETYAITVGGPRPEPRGPRCYRIPFPISALPNDFCTGPRAIDTFAQECHRVLEDVGTRATITLTSECLDCNLWTGGCEARIEGTRIVLSPRLQDCTCTMSGCAGVCESCTTHEVVCTTPALRSGDYTVETAGRGIFARLLVDDVIAPSPIACTPLM